VLYAKSKSFTNSLNLEHCNGFEIHICVLKDKNCLKYISFTCHISARRNIKCEKEKVLKIKKNFDKTDSVHLSK